MVDVGRGAADHNPTREGRSVVVADADLAAIIGQCFGPATKKPAARRLKGGTQSAWSELDCCDPDWY